MWRYSCPNVSAKDRIDWDIPDPKDMNDKDIQRSYSINRQTGSKLDKKYYLNLRLSLLSSDLNTDIELTPISLISLSISDFISSKALSTPCCPAAARANK